MTRYFAFLRAINVGGHTVKMDELRRLFETFGFDTVETFLASGNVIFESDSQEAAALEKRIESGLREALDYEVTTFVRTPAEVAKVAAYQPFPPSAMEMAAAFNVAFLSQTLEGTAVQKLMALKTDIDDFHVHGREVYWLCRKKQSDSTFSNAVLEKTLRLRSTLRGRNTLYKLAAKYT